MWGKREQVILWTAAYLPLFLIMFYRFVDSNDFFKKTEWATWLAQYIDKTVFDVFIIAGIIFISLLIYRLVAIWLFSNYDRQLRAKEIGKIVSIRKYERLSVNDYSFFLMTLLLPLVSLDQASGINLMVTVAIVLIVIAIYVKTDFISVCPVFFVSGRQVFKAIISDQSKEAEVADSSIRQEVIIITRDKSLNLNKKFRTVKLIGDIFYLSSNSNNDDDPDDFQL
ncbi:conserved hypothetical protein [Paenibacillus curdlanolyticus YK9]|uniref:Uncharacterized protein n=1 Tax=Paenibacillus curdlanolyticus YK9 TaxID=717606 RepID=E0ID62_9BACL|nr:hypothetical protein [Paenibacillus curdlanolyticus]EFM09517.1 conserved hypothetical protein [Paenibacillus curdlanolyticus YK9]